ncbi:MAG: hypothetical protein RIG61_06160 [Deltaproteobacteria bacterium]
MGLMARIGNFYTGHAIILAVLFILLSVLVSLFNSYYLTSTLSEQRTQELARYFNTSNKNFSDTAKDILDSQQDIVYVKLLDPDGVLQESYGNGDGDNIEILPLATSENNTILIGLIARDYKSLVLSGALWSALIGIGFSVILLLIFSLFTPAKNDAIEKLINAMKNVSRGDLNAARLDPSESTDDVAMIRAYETFNQMIDRLRKREDIEDDEPVFQPTLIASKDEDITAKHRNVIVFVAKIADFQELSNTLDPAEFNSFLADYRKAASAVISNYGGIIEALLKDEIVAFFNAPEEQTNAELKAICSAVEVLQLLASITRERKMEGKTAISGKIGIALKSIPVYDDSGVPHGIKEITDMARNISNVAPIWRVIVSTDVYHEVSDYVESRELRLGDDSYYSIVGVEEGVV